MKKVFIMCVASAGLILASCGGKDEKGSDASKDANSGKGGATAGGDICECLKSAKSEEDAKKCDPSKSVDELRSIVMECMKKSMPEQTEQTDNSGGGDMSGGETGGAEMPEMPEAPEM